jgi:hypothetical protein
MRGKNLTDVSPYLSGSIRAETIIINGSSHAITEGVFIASVIPITLSKICFIAKTTRIVKGITLHITAQNLSRGHNESRGTIKSSIKKVSIADTKLLEFKLES